MTRPGDKSKEMKLKIYTEQKKIKIKDEKERPATELTDKEWEEIRKNPNLQQLGEIFYLGASPG